MFATDFYSHENRYTPGELLFPTEKALNKWTIIIHEIIGIVSYKIVGYI